MIDDNLLPEMAARIAGLIGIEKTMLLAEQFGYVRIYIPRRETLDDSEHWLVKAIGLEAAGLLADEFSGQEHFYMPRCKHALLEMRNRQIRAERQEGASIRQLSLRHQLSDKQIENICRGHAARHPDLFE